MAKFLERLKGTLMATPMPRPASASYGGERPRDDTGVPVRWPSSGRKRSVAVAAVCVLIAVAPFEALRPVFEIAGQSQSTVEVGLLIVLVAWTAVLGRFGLLRLVRAPLTGPWLVFMLTMFVAAMAANDQANALNMVGRLALAFAVYLIAVTAGPLPIVFVVAVASGVLASILVFLEYANIGSVQDFLTAFRPFVAHVGDQVRAGGSFQYPTIASMYLEVVFALGLGLLALSIDRRRLTASVVVGIALLLIAQAIVFTFTRAGLGTMGTSLAVVSLLRYRTEGFDRVVKVLAVIAAGVLLQIVFTRSPESTRLRLTSEGQEAWYRASVDAPSVLTMAASGTSSVPISLTNIGRQTWDAQTHPRVRVSYHWVHADEDLVVAWEGLRTDLPRSIRPGESVSLEARVEAPRDPGQYRLLWDIEHERRLWFSTEPGAMLTFSRIEVTGERSAVPFPRQALRPLPRAAVRPNRITLWRAAVQMVKDHPVTGVGPDNFRLLYGQYAGLALADPRVHSNNMYLEVLAGGGVLAGVAFAWLLWRATRSCARALHVVHPPHMPVAAALVAACVAIALHGLVDSFLSFTATYVLFAIVLGLVSASHWSFDGHRV